MSSIWVLRGLRDKVVTTKWPRRPDEYADSWRGPATVRAAYAPPIVGSANTPTPDISGNVGGVGGGEGPGVDLAELCPTGAIDDSDGRVRLDQGRCILCGRCVAARPDVFAWSMGSTEPDAVALTREALVVPPLPETDEAIAAVRASLAERTAALRRSVHIRHVDAGSDGSEEWEIQALLGPVYDIARLGFFFTASPRHADVLLVTGAGVPGIAGPLRTTYEGMPDPKVVIAVGTDAVSGGLLADRATGVDGIVPVDVWVPGSPPPPFWILNALLIATGKLAYGGKVAR